MIPRSIGVVTLFQRDLEVAKEFYTRVFGRPPDYADEDVANFNFDNLIVHLEKESAAPDLIGPVALARQDAGARVMLVLWVDDADAACVELAERGVTLINGPKDRPWGVRTACFADPGGHIWEIGQDLDPQPAT